MSLPLSSESLLIAEATMEVLMELQKKKQHGKGDTKGKRYLDMSKIKCFNCGEYGHFAHDCLQARNNTNIARECEQKDKLDPCWIRIVLV